MTAATVRKNVKSWAAWAAHHPYPGGHGGLTAWVRRGVRAVVGAEPPCYVEMAFMGRPVPPSWTPEGAAWRLERGVQKHPAVRAAIAEARAALALDQAKFLSQFCKEDAAFLASYIDAPVAALEGREVNLAPIQAAKAAVVATKAAIQAAQAASR